MELEWKSYKKGSQGPQELGGYLRYVEGYPPEFVQITEVRTYEDPDGHTVTHSFCKEPLPRCAAFMNGELLIWYLGPIDETPLKNQPSTGEYQCHS